MNKKVGVVDMIVIVATLIGLIVVFGYAKPLLIFSHESDVLETKVLFSFPGEKVLIDDNPKFNSPREIAVEDGLSVSFEPGVYYWKTFDGAVSEVRKLTIKNSVELELRKNGAVYEMINSGDEKLNIDIYEGDALLGGIVLTPD